MKKLTLTLAALLALTACTAAPETTPTPTETPAATEAPAEESAAAFPVGTLHTTEERDDENAYYSLGSKEDSMDIHLLRLDYAEAVEKEVCIIPQMDDVSVTTAQLVRPDGTLCGFGEKTDGTSYYQAVSPDGRIELIEIAEKIYPNAYDEYAAYEIGDGYCARMDWQTGEVTRWDAPISQIDQIIGAVDNRILLSRIASDMPLPTDAEMFEAVIQNSQREYDLYDIASNTVEKLFAEPYYPEDGGSWKSYLGCCDGVLYFDRWRPDGDNTATVLLGYDLASGSWQELYAEESTGCVGCYSSPKGFSRGEQLEFVFLQSTPDTLYIYKTADGQVYNVPYHDPTLDAAYGTDENYGRPVALTADGRVLVADGYAWWDGHPSDAFGLIDLDDYLAGSTDYTKVQMWEG